MRQRPRVQLARATWQTRAAVLAILLVVILLAAALGYR